MNKKTTLTAGDEQTAVVKTEPVTDAVFKPMGSDITITLNAKIVKQFIANKTATRVESSITACIGFLMFCKSMIANPFTKYTYMTGFDTKDGAKFEIITGIDLYLKRA